MYNIYDLIPTDRKSFYGKAKVYVLPNGTRLLKSYDTFVMMCRDGEYIRLEDTNCGYTGSVTTTRHIKAFSGMSRKEYNELPEEPSETAERLLYEEDKKRWEGTESNIA